MVTDPDLEITAGPVSKNVFGWSKNKVGGGTWIPLAPLLDLPLSNGDIFVEPRPESLEFTIKL